MAELVNPFNPQTLKKHKAFFLPEPRKGFPTAAKLEAERSGLASFMGTTDYARQLAEDRQLSKLQIGLALAQRGFGSMGAQPRPGEMAISTLGRELLSPLAGDAGAVVTQMLQQRRALKAEQRQEERQLKLAALGQVQTRQSQEYGDELAATNAARQFMLMSGKKDVKVSDAFTVNGVPVPVIVEKDWRGNIRYLDANKKEIAANKIGVYKAPKVIKSNVTNVPNIQRIVVDSESGDETYRQIVAERVTSFNPDGSVSDTVLRDTTNNQPLYLSGPRINARIEPEEGSRTSLYHAPNRKDIWLNRTFVDAFGLPKSMIGVKAELQVSVPKILDPQSGVGAGLLDIVKVRVSGVTYTLRDHKDYDTATGNIVLDTAEGKVTLDSSQLWGLDDPKAFTALPGAGLTVTPENLAEIQKIPGLSGIKSGEALTAERNPVGDIQVRYGRQVISLTKAQEALFQIGDLTAVQQLKAGHTIQTFKKIGELTVLNALANIIPGLGKINVGETIEIQKTPDTGEGSETKYFYLGQEIELNDTQLGSGVFREGKLTQVQALEAGQVPVTWTKKEPLRVPYGNLEKIRKITGLNDITPNETLRVEQDNLGNWRILRGTQVIPLTPAQQNLFVQKGLEDAVTRTNTSTDPITIDGRIIPPGGTVSITETEYRNLDPATRDVLGKVAPVSRARKLVMVGGNKLIQVGGGPHPYLNVLIFAPGYVFNLNAGERAALVKDVPGLKLITSALGQGRATRGNWFRNHYKIFLKEEGLTGRDLTEQQVDTLFSLFPGTRSMNVAALRTQLFKFAKGTPPTATEKKVAKATRATDANLSAYQQAVVKRHSGAEALYTQLFNRGAVAIPWDQLSYQKREAFASIPRRDPRLLDPEQTNAAILEAEEALQKEKVALASPDAADLSEFATKARLLSILKHIRDEDLLNNTGIIRGIFGVLGSSLSDWPVVGSKNAGKLSFMLQQLGANLKILEAGEDRPSNWRLQLIQATLPEFTTAEYLNNKNLEQAILLIGNDMRAQLDPSLQSSHVITPQLLAIAAEAGIKVPDIDHSKQRWLDPTEQPEPIFTRREFLASLGKTRFTHFDFELIYPGREVVLIDKNNPEARWLKVDDKTKGLTRGNYYVIRTMDGKTAARGAKVIDITNRVPRGD